MGYSKGSVAPPPAVYRDEPDYAETASMASAVLLGDVDFPDEELPSYEDTPSQPSPFLDFSASSGSVNEALLMSQHRPPPELAFHSHDMFCSEFRTRFPNYSTDSKQLYQMIKNQAAYPPSYFVQIHGTHTETRRNGNKETKDKIVDFLIRINITHLLGKLGSGDIELLPDNKRGYRGTRLPSITPTVGDELDEEAGRMDELKLWCEKYVEDPSKVKCFTLKRKIINHDKKKLEQLLRSAIAETNYRGHVSIDFPSNCNSLIVYSPGILNEWRITNWIRWVFYCTFLWIFAWPVLFLLTARYSVVKVIFSYADKLDANDMTRVPTVMSEVDWFHRWQRAIQRAALARMNCKDQTLDEVYRAATEQADLRGAQQGRQPDIPRTGNSFADGALGLLGQGLRVAENFNNSRGWGGDC